MTVINLCSVTAFNKDFSVDRGVDKGENVHLWGWVWKSVLSTQFYRERKTAVNIILIVLKFLCFV